MKSDAKSVAKSDTKNDAKSNTKSDAKSNTKSDAKSNTLLVYILHTVNENVQQLKFL